MSYGVIFVLFKKMLRVINYFVATLMIIVFLMTAVIVVYSKATDGNMSLFGYQMKTVLSGSMEPNIQTGSVIFIKTDKDMRHFHEGDVITFKVDENVLVTHRIIEVKKDGEVYLTKGDANSHVDISPVLAENIVGEYTGVTIPYLGYAINFVNSKQGALFVLILPGIILIGYSIVTIWKVIRLIDQSKKDVKAETE